MVLQPVVDEIGRGGRTSESPLGRESTHSRPPGRRNSSHWKSTAALDETIFAPWLGDERARGRVYVVEPITNTMPHAHPLGI
jgi:hypothetical protein